MKEFIIENKKVVVYPSKDRYRPIIYFPTFFDEGREVYLKLQEQKCFDFTLVAISGLDWNCDMSPWKAPSIFSDGADFTGGADHFLKLFIEQIIPKVEVEVQEIIRWRGIAGYSLAGLFAIYSLYQTELFSRVASISGSLWFPNFKKYIFSHKMKRIPKYLYFSLGNKECKTKQIQLRMVQENTKEIEMFYKSQGINTVFQLNSGNHYKNTVARTVAGIEWILEK